MRKKQIIILGVVLGLSLLGLIFTQARYPRDGRFIEEIGTYNPLTEPADIKIDAEKAQKWLGNGAQPTDTVKVLLKKSGITK